MRYIGILWNTLINLFILQNLTNNNWNALINYIYRVHMCVTEYLYIYGKCFHFEWLIIKKYQNWFWHNWPVCTVLGISDRYQICRITQHYYSKHSAGFTGQKAKQKSSMKYRPGFLLYFCCRLKEIGFDIA